MTPTVDPLESFQHLFSIAVVLSLARTLELGKLSPEVICYFLLIQLAHHFSEHKDEQAVQNICRIYGGHLVPASVLHEQKNDPEDRH